MADFTSRLTNAVALLRDDQFLDEIDKRINMVATATTPSIDILAGATTMQTARRIAVLAGSFNPPTNAHIALADAAKATGLFDVIVWSISRHTVDKEQIEQAQLAMRLVTLIAMTQQRSHEAVAIINRGLYVDQAATIHTAFPQLTELTFILGFDKIVQLLDARYYVDRTAALTELFAQARVSVAPRGGDDEKALYDLIDRPENQKWASFISFLPLPAHVRQLSSSAIRQQPDPVSQTHDNIPPESLALIQSGAYDSTDTQ